MKRAPELRAQQSSDEYEEEKTQTAACPFDTDGDGDCGRPNCPHCAPSTTGKGRAFVNRDGETTRRADEEAKIPSKESIRQAWDAITANEERGMSLDANPNQRDSRAIERLRRDDEK